MSGRVENSGYEKVCKVKWVSLKVLANDIGIANAQRNLKAVKVLENVSQHISAVLDSSTKCKIF